MNARKLPPISITDWEVHNDYLLIPGIIYSEEFIATFKEYPPSQAPASFTVNPEAILDMLYQQLANATTKD